MQQTQRAPIANDSNSGDVSNVSNVSHVSVLNTSNSNYNPLIAMSLYGNKNNIFKQRIAFKPDIDDGSSKLQLKDIKQYVNGKTVEQLVKKMRNRLIHYKHGEIISILYVNNTKYYNTTIAVGDGHDDANLSLACKFICV